MPIVISRSGDCRAQGELTAEQRQRLWEEIVKTFASQNKELLAKATITHGKGEVT